MTSLSDKRFKGYTGDIIEGCEEWYWDYSERDVKEAIKQIEEKNIWQPECKHICISRKDLNEIFGDKLI